MSSTTLSSAPALRDCRAHRIKSSFSARSMVDGVTRETGA